MNNEMATYCTYLRFYHRQFLTAYKIMRNNLQNSDLQPGVIFDGITESLSCLAQSCKPNMVDGNEVLSKIVDENEVSSQIDVSTQIKLALSDLIRATFDCYEMTFILITGEIDGICADPQMAKRCINMKYGLFLEEYEQFKRLFAEARDERRAKSDMGRTAIDAYANAIALGQKLANMIDPAKRDEYMREMGETSLLSKEFMIKSLAHQISLHPKRTAAIIIGMIVFIAIAFFTWLLEFVFNKVALK